MSKTSSVSCWIGMVQDQIYFIGWTDKDTDNGVLITKLCSFLMETHLLSTVKKAYPSLNIR